MKLTGLSRQIALSMMAMTLGVTLISVLTSYLFYYLWQTYWPEHFPEIGFIPTGPEWGWLIGTTLASLVLSAFVAAKLSRRILVPLNSVAESIRAVVQGNLSARAVAGDRSLGEAAELADNFNSLAAQLHRMTEEQTFWNAAIAHELRTPITILRGRLQGLAEGVFPPTESQFRSLLTQVEGLGRLVEDLRVVSLAESGHLDLQIHEVDLAAELMSEVEFLRDALASVNQQLILDLKVQHAYCDPVRIRQAVLALLENARRHAVPGGIRIQTNIENGWCHLCVEDDGPGIPEEFVPHVFTAFRRVDNAQSNGSGLGLAVVAAIAQAHGGQAACYATSRGGTVFELRWPQTLQASKTN